LHGPLATRVGLRRFSLAAALVALAAVGGAAATAALAGTWQRLPAPPIAPEESLVSVWTGKEMLVFGRITKQLTPDVVRLNVAAAFNPTTRTWRRLPPAGQTGAFLAYSAAWTGRDMVVWGQGLRMAFNPTTNRWRHLPGSPLLSVHDGFGVVVWTGRELIGWGGGCCGDAFDDGVAFNPKTNRWRRLSRSPLAGSQHPLGAWTGHEVIVLVGNTDPNGKAWPSRLARAAAYNPSTDRWRRLPPIPRQRGGANAVWDGHELLVVDGISLAENGSPGVPARVGYAFSPTTGRWRALPPMESGRFGAAAAWTGKELLVWGGQSSGPGSTRVTVPAHGLAYDPTANRWSSLPPAPLPGRLDPAAVWTGRSLLLWGGQIPKPGGLRTFADGASFTPGE
jgi:N-acetylneuraminic acid mutarotase